MSGPQDFVVAAKNAARDILTDEARADARRVAQDLSPPPDSGESLFRLCQAIKATLLALPELPIGTRAAAAVALQHLARTVDLILRIASAKAAPTAAEVLERRAAARTTHESLDEEQIPYRPGVD